MVEEECLLIFKIEDVSLKLCAELSECVIGNLNWRDFKIDTFTILFDDVSTLLMQE